MHHRSQKRAGGCCGASAGLKLVRVLSWPCILQKSEAKARLGQLWGQQSHALHQAGLEA